MATKKSSSKSSSSKKSSSSSKPTIKKSTVKKVVKEVKKLPTPVIVILVILLVAGIGVFVYINRDKIAAILKGETTTTKFENTITFNSNTLVREDGELLVHYINVGQGDSILIELPDGDEMLIDCGCKGVTQDYETFVKPYLIEYVEDMTIEHLVLTHTDEDHVVYLDNVVDDFQVSNIYMPYILAAPGTSSTQKANAQAKIDALDKEKLALFKDIDTIDTIVYANFFISALSESDCEIHLNVDDDEYTTNNVITASDNSYTITFICPTLEFYTDTTLEDAHAKNAVSPVIILETNNRKLVFTGDSNAYWDSKGNLKTNEGNEWFMVERIKTLYGDDGIDCDVLKVAHHGAGEASSNEFLDVIDCEYGIISCGEGNTYNHPRQEALDRLAGHQMTVLRTDLNGTIQCLVDASGEITFSMDDSSHSQDEELTGF